MASAADGGSQLPQDAAATGTVAEPDVQAAPIPETADAALRAVLDGLHDNRAEAAWDALPASYQRDVNDLVHLFATRTNPEAWKWMAQIARKGAVVLRLPRDDHEEANVIDAAVKDDKDQDDADAIQQASIKDRLAISTNERTRLPAPLARRQNQSAKMPDKMPETIADQQRREAVANLFDQIAAAGPAGLAKLKTANVGTLLRRSESRTLLEVWRTAASTDFGTEDVQDILALIADPSTVRLAVKESTDESAIVEITFPNDVPAEIECVRVDGKWIPRLLADAWPGMISNLKRDLAESLPSETATENFGPVFQYLGMLDMSFDAELAYARGDKDDAPDEVHRSTWLDVPMLLLDYLIAGPPAPLEQDEMMADAEGALVDFTARSETGSPGDDSRSEASAFEQLVGKSLVEEGKRVAVVCHAGAVVQTEHPTFTRGVIEEISRRFKVGKINVVEPDKVVSWTKEHSGVTADSDLSALGTELEADYVVQFHIETLGFAEENYPELHRGRAQGRVVVLELAADDKGEKRARVIFKQPFESKHPNNPSIAADPEEPDAFKQRYLARLHYELARLFLGNR